MRAVLLVALALVLGGSALALATPIAEATDVCLSYWFCVIKCTTPPTYYCECAPECPPPPGPEY